MDAMRNAAEAVRNGMSFRKACEAYSVLRGTLFRFVKGGTNTGQKGPIKPVLTSQQESELTEHILQLQTLLIEKERELYSRTSWYEFRS